MFRSLYTTPVPDSPVRRLAPLALLAFLVTAGGSLSQATAPPRQVADASELQRTILEEAASRSEIMNNLTYLSDVIGPRLTGSAAVQRANAWTAERMKAYGLSGVHLEGYPIPERWERGSAYVRILEPDNGRTLSVASYGWAPGTNGRIQGDIVALTTRTAAELEQLKGQLKGAIVLQGP